MSPEEMKKARNEAVKNIFKKVDKVVDELIEIEDEYCSWDEWKRSDIISKAKNVLTTGFKKEFEENEK